MVKFCIICSFFIIITSIICGLFVLLNNPKSDKIKLSAYILWFRRDMGRFSISMAYL